MWKLEFTFFILLLLVIWKLIKYSIRFLNFLIFLELMVIFQIYCIVYFISIQDYTIILKYLIIISCETAVGLSLLVIYVRNFSLDKLGSFFLKKLCEGF